MAGIKIGMAQMPVLFGKAEELRVVEIETVPHSRKGTELTAYVSSQP